MADGEEVRFLVVNDAAVGRDAHLAVRKCIKSIDCLIGRGARCQVDQNLDVGRRIVVYLAYFYLSFIDSFQDGVDDRSRGSAIRDFGDGQRLVVYFIDLRPYLDCSTAFAVVVFRYVDRTSGLEVGI